jgi:hypothetical protein
MGGIVLNKDILRADLLAERFREYSTEQDDLHSGFDEQTAGYLLVRYPRLTVFSTDARFRGAIKLRRRLKLPGGGNGVADD